MRGTQTGKHKNWNEFRKVQLEEEKSNKVCAKTNLPGKKLQLNSGHNFSQTFKLQSAWHFTLTNRFCPAANKCEMNDSRHAHYNKAN